MKIPVTTTYAPEFREAVQVRRVRAVDVRGMVNAVFEYMINHGSPYDPDTIASGNYGPELEPYRESLTLFIEAWHSLAFAYDDGSANDLAGWQDRNLSRWKVLALRALFRPARRRLFVAKSEAAQW
jgi:hypothetical protein